MKRYITGFLLFTLVLALSACGGKAESEPSTYALTWQEQYDLGVRYLSEGDYEEAIIAFTAAIEIDPKQTDAYVGLADAYIGIGDYDKASKAIIQGQEACGDGEAFDRVLNNLSFLQSGESGIQITSLYFDREAYLAGNETDFLVSVAYCCPEDEDCILMIGSNTEEPYSFAVMDEDYQVTGSGGYQFHVSVTPVQWEGSYFGIYVDLSEADHAETWTPFAWDLLYIDLEGHISGFSGSEDNSLSEQDAERKEQTDYERNHIPYAAKYVEVICEVVLDHYGEELFYDLVYLDDNDIPELIVGVPGYYVSIYTFYDGQVYQIADEWAYGAFGNNGYEYVPYSNVIYNLNADYAGMITYENFYKINENHRIENYNEDALCTWYFVDLNNNGSPDDDEVYDPNAARYFVGEREIEKYEYITPQVSGEYQLIEPDKNIDEIFEVLYKLAGTSQTTIALPEKIYQTNWKELGGSDEYCPWVAFSSQGRCTMFITYGEYAGEAKASYSVYQFDEDTTVVKLKFTSGTTIHFLKVNSSGWKLIDTECIGFSFPGYIFAPKD